MARLDDRPELPEEDRTIVTAGRLRILLKDGVTFENPFGNTIVIERVYFSKNKQRPTITYEITKGDTTTRIREPYAEFLKGKTFHGYMGKGPMSFTHWTVTKK